MLKFSKAVLRSIVVLALCLGAAAKAETAAPSATTAGAATIPAPDALLMLIRSHVLAVGQANTANTYDVLRALGSEKFRTLNTNAALSATFAAVRDLKLDFSPVVVTTPVLTDAPAIIDGKLRIYGAFPTAPIEIPFGMLFEIESGVWKLAAISVGARPSAQVAAVTLPMADPAKAAPLAATPKDAKPAIKK